jgi:transcription initiation factor TFIID subunit 2
MMANDSFISYIFSSLSNEPSAYFRDRLWRRIHRGLASIALGETKMGRTQKGDVEMDGFSIDTGDAMIASRNEAIERSTVEGALAWMRTQLKDNKALEGAIMDALRYHLTRRCICQSLANPYTRSPIIGLKDFAELLDLCAHLYPTKDYLPVTLHYPHFWRVQHLGEAKLRFSHTERYRTKPITPRPDLKRKKTADERSESPDAKRRKSAGGPIKITFGGVNKAPTMPTVPTSAQSSLPSPGPSKPTIAFTAKAASPPRNESPGLQPPTAPAKVVPPKKQPSPAVSKKPSPAVSKKPSPAASRASPATSRTSPVPKAAATAKAERKRKIIKLKFKHKKQEYADIVRGRAIVRLADKANTSGAVVPHMDDDDDDEDDAPLASRNPAVHINGVAPVKAEMAPPAPPLSSIPAPNERKLSETPPAQKAGGPMKLKLKFGGHK